MNRHEARRQTLEVLYAADQTGRLDVGEVDESVRALAAAVWEMREHLDGAIERASVRWRVARMPAVDRCVLRLGLYELLETRVPAAVVIDEAVRLAKEYSTARSGSFVNGILGRLARESGEPSDREEP